MSNRSKYKGQKETRKATDQVPSVTISNEDSNNFVLRDRITVVLNQLKSEKLNITVHELKSLSINNEDKMNALVKVVFEKGVSNMEEGVTYAKLCQQLSAFKVISVGSKCICFKELLVEHSQQEFQTCFSKDGSDASQEVYTKMDAIGFWSPASRSGLPLRHGVKFNKMGTVMFLGQLFKCQILTVHFMRVVINRLFSLIDEDVWNFLCSLLLLIGSEMETQKQDLGLCLTKMQDMISKRQLPASAKDQLKHVIKCRQNKWIPPDTLCRELRSALKQVSPLLGRFQEGYEEHDEWALGTLTHVVVPRRVLRNQLRQAKNGFNEV